MSSKNRRQKVRRFRDDWDYVDNESRRKRNKQIQIRRKRRVKRDHQLKDLEDDDNLDWS